MADSTTAVDLFPNKFKEHQSDALLTNKMLLVGIVQSIDQYPALHESKDFYIFNIQLPSPDGFKGGVRVRVLHSNQRAFKPGDPFSEIVQNEYCFRQYVSKTNQKTGELTRESFPTNVFMIA